MITGNKGEWSEIYTLFKLLGDKILYPGDSDLNKIKNAFYPIIRILRSESNGNFEYSVEVDLIIISGKQKFAVPIQEFKEKAIFLLNKIRKSTQGTFSVPEIEFFMAEINCLSLKANSSAKTDIIVMVHDPRTNHQPILGFSIKSQLGSPSTLLNAGKTTNFVYEIEGIKLSSVEMEEINEITSRSKIKDRIERIYSLGGNLNFRKTEKRIFSNNLILIDSLLPEILGELVLKFYTETESKIEGLVTDMERENPSQFDDFNNHSFYSYKIKRFLTDIALGMMPSQVWSGKLDATGGYLVVREDGEIVCYHVYSRNEFEDYLLKNTKLETASSTRHEFGTIYRENNDFYIKLNLQIRFLK